MKLITAPEVLPIAVADGTSPLPVVFLAGSIEQGLASDWQADIVQQLQVVDGTALSPRRKEWDPDWPQDPLFEPFREQVEWELAGIDAADIVFMHFEAGTKSPITLLELGIALAQGKRTIISCSTDFWRHGNVVITANRFGTPVYETIEEAIQTLLDALA